jgi:hypothetical protein
MLGLSASNKERTSIYGVKKIGGRVDKGNSKKCGHEIILGINCELRMYCIFIHLSGNYAYPATRTKSSISL